MSAGTNRAKVDANQKQLVELWRKAGAEVQSIAGVGKGCPDVLVAYQGVWRVVEIKDGSKSPSQRKLTDDEVAWHEKFSRYAPVDIVENDEQALELLERMRGDL